MNRTEAKELLPVITAFANGENVQYQSASGEWYAPPGYPSFYSAVKWRIAPKPKTCERWCFVMFLYEAIFWYSSSSESDALSKKSEIARDNPDATFSPIVRVEFVEEQTCEK